MRRARSVYSFRRPTVTDIEVKFQEEARNVAVQQLQALTGVAKGLTRANDVFDLDDDGEEDPHIVRVRQDDRMVRLREQMLQAIRAIINIWSSDAGVSEVRVAL